VLARWRALPLPQRIAGLVVLALLGGIGFLPLFGGPGYEQSLASGLILPSAAAIATALDLSSGDAARWAPLPCVARGLLTGLAFAAVAFLTALLHGLRVGICDLWGGTLLFLLTAGLGAPLGGLWGAVVAERCRGRKRRRTLCVLLGLAGPLAGVAVSLARFYGSPMVFMYDPFFGYFSGALYDTVVDVRTELWTYRAATLATLTGAVLLAGAMTRSADGKISLASLGDSPALWARAWLGVALLLASQGASVEGPELGHWQTSSTIAAELGGLARGPRCDVVHPDSLLADQVALLVRDCEQELAADEQRLGAHLPGRLTAFVFKDAEQKRRLMGAADTQIAKPWRQEVYVQMAGYPHPVLGHEIAHVVAGSFARGPFRVAGRVGGLWPNPGLIEGTAEATSPDDDALTDAQWARAMLDLGILPSLRDLFGIGFMGENSSKGYTVASAFVSFVIERWGAQVVRAWYGGASIETLAEGWPALEADFAAWVRALPMPEGAAAYAKAKFDRPSVWGRRCPHAVDALDRRADQCRDERRIARADELYSAALERDPHDWHAQFDRARLRMWYRDDATGRTELSRVAEDDHNPRTWRDRAEEALADDDLVRGRKDRAALSYHGLAARSLDEDAARTLEVKAMSVDNPPAQRAVIDLLIGQPGRPVDTWLGALSLGAWAEETHEPLAGYLIGKNLAVREDWERAAAQLDHALDEGIQAAHVSRELLRQRAICACALGDDAALGHVRARMDAEDTPFVGAASGRRAWLLRLIARCTQVRP
jgi:hypothetical protein